MLIVAVVETSPFDGLLWSNRLRLNCAKRGIIVCTISSMICTIHVYDDKVNENQSQASPVPTGHLPSANRWRAWVESLESCPSYDTSLVSAVA